MKIAHKFASGVLRLVSSRGHYVRIDNNSSFEGSMLSSVEFFKRFGHGADFRGKTVLDVGCGTGATCIYVGMNGGKKVVGVDISTKALCFARSKLEESSTLKSVVSFKYLSEVGDEKFDIVLSKDCFEHYEDPEELVFALRRHLKPDGCMVIGFSPLWKSPYGGHVGNFSKLPWIHLIFPESVLIPELRRFAEDNSISSFKQIGGGLNKMTCTRFLKIVNQTGLRISYFRTNLSSDAKARLLLKIFNILSLIPGAREYFTVSLYAILIPQNLTR